MCALSVVQFFHRGAEHTLSLNERKNKLKEWNCGPDHARKFMEATGDYVAENGIFHENCKLRFWGEWEPQSKVEFLKTAKTGDYPRYLHYPILCKKNLLSPTIPCVTSDCLGRTGKRCSPNFQNTDPLVFGPSFMYSLCQQRGGLLTLNPGSIIIFGSLISFNSPFSVKKYFIIIF